MIKSEPKSIINFMGSHYDLLHNLFNIHIKDGIITDEVLVVELEKYEKDVRSKLIEYRILVEQNDDFSFNEPYLVLFEFIHQQFKPLLPEEIEQFGQSIRTLFLKIKKGLNEDKNILLERITALSNQVTKFNNSVVNNTKSLLHESRELKANTNQIDHQEKIKKASHLIQNYITPLNDILDVNHSQSIYNQLLKISRFSNTRRFDKKDETVRRAFEQLYSLLRQVGKDLNAQSVTLSNELLPLIERIKTENQYLKGFHYYLTGGKCYKKDTPVPQFLSNSNESTYSAFIYENTKEFFDQFKNEEDIIVIEEAGAQNNWIFDKPKYKADLNQQLPINNFFDWCEQAIKNNGEEFTFNNFFMVTSLIFEEDYEVIVDEDHENLTIIDSDRELIMPKLKIEKRHVSTES